MYYNAKKQRIKEMIYISIILLTAIISTYIIYDHFESSRLKEYNSTSLEVTYQEETAEKITLNKVTPVTDSVGLSSKAYTFTIKNNQDHQVKYNIVLKDDKVLNDKETAVIPKDIIKVSIRESKNDTTIHTLSSLEKGVLLETSLKTNETKDYSIRVWTTNENNNLSGAKLKYNGLIQIIEETNELAISKGNK